MYIYTFCAARPGSLIEALLLLPASRHKSQYFIRIIIIKLNKHLDFPLTSKINEDGVRDFINKTLPGEMGPESGDFNVHVAF